MQLLTEGKHAIGLESTVIDMTVEPPVVLRPGAVGIEELEKIIGKVRPGYKDGEAETDASSSGKDRQVRNTGITLLIQR